MTARTKKAKRLTVGELIERLENIELPLNEVVIFNSRGEYEAPKLTLVIPSKTRGRTPNAIEAGRTARILLSAESDE